MTTEAQLGLIGGTMGLLTGFSILSGVEIIYYLLRFQFLLVLKKSSTQALKWNAIQVIASPQVFHVSQGSQG